MISDGIKTDLRVLHNLAVTASRRWPVAEEYDAQLLYRRARGWPLLLGDPAYELQHLGELLVDGGREA